MLDSLRAGSYDRVTVSGGGIEPCIGPTFFTGASPVAGLDMLIVETASLAEWKSLVDHDATSDDDEDPDAELGAIFGVVRDAAGNPVAGATIETSPPAGAISYFNEEGVPDPFTFATTSSGRFIVLDMPEFDYTVTAYTGTSMLGAPAIGRAYGRVAAMMVSTLSPTPFRPIQGTVSNEAGAPVANASVAWVFDSSVATTTNAGGTFFLREIPDGLDLTVRAQATGFRPSLTFRRSRDETPNRLAIGVKLVGEATIASWETAFGLVQAPSLGLIYGRVLDDKGAPVAGARVSSDPAAGTVVYFNALGAPAPAATSTSASGLFAIFNVPVGNLVLSATAAHEALKDVVAPSEAGAITTGEILGTALVSYEARVVDELFQTSTIGGAVVSVVERPTLATIADAAGVFRFSDATGNGLPVGEPLTFKIVRNGFKPSYTFMRTLTEDTVCTRANCICPSPSSDDYDPDCKEGSTFYVISETGYSNLFLQARTTPNSARGLVSAGVFFTNDVAAIGLQASLSPASGVLRYPPDGRFAAGQINSFGAAQFLNCAPIVSGFVVSDPRNDEATLVPIRIFPDSVSLDAQVRIDCNPPVDGEPVRNIYPCNGAVMKGKGKDAFFQWEPGSNQHGTVQIATDLAFARCEDPDAEGTCLKGKDRTQPFWHAPKDFWKKVKNLGTEGTPVYWRVRLKDVDGNVTTTTPFVFLIP